MWEVHCYSIQVHPSSTTHGLCLEPGRRLLARKGGRQDVLVCKQSYCTKTNSSEPSDAATAPKSFYSDSIVRSSYSVPNLGPYNIF